MQEMNAIKCIRKCHRSRGWDEWALNTKEYEKMNKDNRSKYAVCVFVYCEQQLKNFNNKKQLLCALWVRQHRQTVHTVR